MELLLYAWILFFILLAAGAVYLAYRVGRSLLKKSSEHRRLMRAARARYEAMLARDHHACAFCEVPIDKTKDIYSDALGWVHERCYTNNVPKGVSNEVREIVESAASVGGISRVRNPR